MNIAIKGHPTRGKEVIQLLEMLGGKSNGNMNGYNDDLYYYIAKDGLIYGSGIEYEELICNYTKFTLEEFEEKFPYKVDDVVVNHKYGKGDITQMLWIDNEIVYEIHFEDCMAYCKANELCKYDASKGLLLQELKEYLSHATREELDKTMEEIEIALAPFKVGDKVIVKGYEEMGEDEVICVFITYDGDIKFKTKNHLDTHYFMEDNLIKVGESNKEETMEEKITNKANKTIFEGNAQSCNIMNDIIKKIKIDIPKDYEFVGIDDNKIVLTLKQPQYPKTYEECCEILDILGNINIEGYKKELLLSLQKLLICHSAYLKIAGEQMGLGKPWKYDISKDEFSYAISYQYGYIQKNGIRHKNAILAFPTEEMRDAFYENFKVLIEECKELL